MRRFLLWMVVGAFSGIVVATLAAPKVLETFLATTGAKDAMCQCSELVANTASTLIQTQIYGAAAGAVLFPLAAWLIRRTWGRRHGGETPPVSTTANPGTPVR
jgi:hypothetical protein